MQPSHAFTLREKTIKETAETCVYTSVGCRKSLDYSLHMNYRKLFKVSLTKKNGGSEKNQQKTTAKLVESLMGKRPELRLEFIKENAKFVKDLYI